MKNMLGSARWCFLACGCAWLAAGCGSGPKLPSLVPVTGKVTIGGQPANGGQVALIPQAEGMLPQGVMATGIIDSAGSYKITTNGKDGAPPGQYKVAVSPPTLPAPGGKTAESMELYKRYSGKDTTLMIDVKASGGSYDLDLTP
jgi:hypothetical protein